MRTLAFVFLSVMLVSCAPKKDEPAPVGSPTPRQTREPAAVEELKRPQRSQVRAESAARTGQIYFASLQILTETVASRGCEDEVRYEEGRIEDYIAELENSQLLFYLDQEVEAQVFNLRIQAIGFDESRFRGSLVDEEPVDWHPYELALRVRPGGAVQIEFFDQVHSLDLTTVPIISFRATEQRSPECEVTHNVNLFAEDAGRYPLQRSVN